MLTTSTSRLGRPRPPAAGARDERVGRRPARERAGAAGGVPRGRLQLPDDRPAGGGRAGAARQARRGRRAAPRASPTATPRRSPRSTGLRAVADPAYGTSQLPVLLGGGAAGATRSTARGCWRTWPRPASRPGAASWPPTASRRTPRHTGTTPLPVTERLTDTTLILPLFHQMSDSEQARVIDALRAADERRMSGCPGRCERAGPRGAGRRAAARAVRPDRASLDDDPRRWGSELAGVPVRRRARPVVEYADHPCWSAPGRAARGARSSARLPDAGRRRRTGTRPCVHPRVDVPAGLHGRRGQHPARAAWSLTADVYASATRRGDART